MILPWKSPLKAIPRFQSAIVDSGGLVFVAHDYCEQGEKEGWLTYSGYYFDHMNRLVYTYSLNSPTEVTRR